MGPTSLLLMTVGRGYEVSSASLEDLLPQLQSNSPAITELFIHLDQLTKDQVGIFASALKGNFKITSIWVRGIESVEKDVFSILLQALMGLPLSRLRLMSWVEKDKFAHLATCLSSMQTLTDFELHGDHPTPKGIRALMRSLTALPLLRSLEFTCRGVAFEAMTVGYRRAGPRSLPVLLPDLKAHLVHYLDFWYTCHLSSLDIEVLVSALCNNSALHSVAFHSVYEMPEFHKLAHVLATLSLKSLVVNGISAQHIQELTTIVLAGKSSLTRIDLTIGGEPPAELMLQLIKAVAQVENLEMVTLRTPEWSVGR